MHTFDARTIADLFDHSHHLGQCDQENIFDFVAAIKDLITPVSGGLMRMVQNGARMAMLALLFCSTLTLAQSYYLTGKVVYENGGPISGATLYLVNLKDSTTSYSGGFFSLVGYYSAENKIATFQKNKFLRPEMKNGSLHFSVFAPKTKVKLELFDLRGKCIGMIAHTELVSGSYSVPVDNPRYARQVCVLKAAIGASVEVFRLPMMKAVHYGRSLNQNVSVSAMGLTKRDAALSDTIVAQFGSNPIQKQVVRGDHDRFAFIFSSPPGSAGDVDASLSAMPLVMPVLQVQYSRFGSYYANVLRPVSCTPAFNSDTLSYSASFDSSVIVGIQPRTTSAAAKISVLLDNAPSALVPWWHQIVSGEYYYTLDALYPCTLSTPNQTRTFSTTVTAGDNVTKRTYKISLNR